MPATTGQGKAGRAVEPLFGAHELGWFECSAEKETRDVELRNVPGLCDILADVLGLVEDFQTCGFGQGHVVGLRA